MKKCAKCSTERPLESFSRSSRASDGKHAYCKSCMSTYNREMRTSKRYAPRDPEKAKAQKRAYAERNREKIAAYKREYNKRNRQMIAARTRSWHLKRKYGVDANEWDALFAAQGHACAACGGDNADSRYWHTDHCHETGVVRGILCHCCNIALGHVRDSRETLLALLNYLDRTRPS